jgi:hypothetical protein
MVERFIFCLRLLVIMINKGFRSIKVGGEGWLVVAISFSGYANPDEDEYNC